MNNYPKISIVVPLYNVEAYIVDCLQSVARQTYGGAMECIIVDDRGTDNSLALVNQFIADYKGAISFQVFRHNQNRGLSAARNTGLNAATGDYVYFLDSDDWLSCDCIHVLAKPLEKGQYDMVVGAFQIEGEDWGVPKLLLEEGEYRESVILEEYCNRRFYMMACNKLCNKSFLLQSGLYFKEGIIHEDDLWSFVAATKMSSMYVVQQKTYHYLLRNESLGGVPCKRQSIQHRDGYAETVIAMAKYSGCAQNCSLAFENLFYNYTEKVRRISKSIHCDFMHIYIEYRKFHKYNPFRAYRLHQIKKKRFIFELNNIMPNTIGYHYLLLMHKLLD